MQTKMTFLLLLIFALFVQACTITKRTFNRGYSIEWRKLAHRGSSENVHQSSFEQEEKSENKSMMSRDQEDIKTDSDEKPFSTIEFPTEPVVLDSLAEKYFYTTEESKSKQTAITAPKNEDEFSKPERVNPLGLRILVTIVLLICATLVSLYIGFLLGAIFDAFAWVMIGLVFFSFLFNVLNLRYNRKVAHNETEAKEGRINRGILSFFLTILTVGLASLLLFLG